MLFTPGGGATLDFGIYPIAMTSLIFGGGRPEHIKATGYLTDTGVDELASITIKYPGKNMFPLCVRQSSGAFITTLSIPYYQNLVM